MKLYELVEIMNIYNVGLRGADILGIKKIDMMHKDTDELLKKYGNYTVKKLTNLAYQGDVIVI